MDSVAGPRRSSQIDAAEWIKPRLAQFATGVTSLVPKGFEAYAKILHPAEEPGRYHGEQLVRWRDVAHWSGRTLQPLSMFATIATPLASIDSDPPWRSDGPKAGTLYPAYAERLTSILRDATTIADRCWFCVWSGFGWGPGPTAAVRPIGAPPEPTGPIISPHDKMGPKVELPNRSYYLYQGAIGDGLALDEIDQGEAPHLWWPDDATWCVATDIDLPYTFVGAPSETIDRICSDDVIEAMPVAADDPFHQGDDAIDRQIDLAIAELLEHGSVRIETVRGWIIEATLDRPRPMQSGSFRITSRSTATTSNSSGWSPIKRWNEDHVRTMMWSKLWWALHSAGGKGR